MKPPLVPAAFDFVGELPLLTEGVDEDVVALLLLLLLLLLLGVTVEPGSRLVEVPPTALAGAEALETDLAALAKS